MSDDIIIEEAADVAESQQAINLTYIEMKHRYLSSYNIELDNRFVYHHGELNAKSVLRTIKAITFLDTLSSEPITLFINSGGGEVLQTLSLIDCIRTCDSDVIGIGTGMIASAAIPLLASCDVKKGTKYASFMYHSISWGTFQPLRLAEQETDLKESKRIQNVINKLLAERTKKSYSFWSSHKHVDFSFDAEQAKEFGIIDEIV